jgi:hypothetical protein
MWLELGRLPIRGVTCVTCVLAICFAVLRDVTVLTASQGSRVGKRDSADSVCQLPGRNICSLCRATAMNVAQICLTRDSVGSFGHLGTEAAPSSRYRPGRPPRPARTVFGGQRAVEDRPAVVDLTEPVAVRDADVAVVRDVGALTVDRAQAPDLDAENFDSREEIVEAVIALCDCSEKITRQIAVSST